MNFNIIDEAVKAQIAETLVLIDKIDIVYDYAIEDVNEIVEYIYKYINDNINTFDSWERAKNSILLHLFIKKNDFHFSNNIHSPLAI